MTNRINNDILPSQTRQNPFTIHRPQTQPVLLNTFPIEIKIKHKDELALALADDPAPSSPGDTQPPRLTYCNAHIPSVKAGITSYLARKGRTGKERMGG